MRQHGKYGKRPADPYRPAIRLARSLTGVIPDHPIAADYLATLPGWKMLGNDIQGNCVAVTWANTRRLVTAALGATENYPSQVMVDTVYATQNPAGQDNGMDIQTLLGWLTKNAGPDGAKVAGFAKVDAANPDEVKAAIAIFGSLWTGFTVLQANETEFDHGQPWDYTPGSPDIGGHSVITGGYGQPGAGPLGGDERFITWAEETSFTDRFWLREVDECWAVIWPEHLGSKEFLAGVDLSTFAADYEAITGRPFPVPVPPAPVPVPVPVSPDQVFAADPRMAAWAAHRHTGDNAYAARTWTAWRKTVTGATP